MRDLSAIQKVGFGNKNDFYWILYNKHSGNTYLKFAHYNNVIALVNLISLFFKLDTL